MADAAALLLVLRASRGPMIRLTWLPIPQGPQAVGCYWNMKLEKADKVGKLAGGVEPVSAMFCGGCTCVAREREVMGCGCTAGLKAAFWGTVSLGVSTRRWSVL